MNEIVVKKADLRAIVQKNRDAHRAIFEEAVAGYRTQSVAILEDHIARIRAGKVVRVSVVLPFPEDHTRDYDRVLAMLDMDLQEEIELEEHDFAQYVQDDWSWKRQFLFSNSSYSTSASTQLDALDNRA